MAWCEPPAPSWLGSGSDAEQLDLVATEAGANCDRVLLVGEVKSGQRLCGPAELGRLDAIVERLRARPPKARRVDGDVKRILVSRSGFTADLVRTASRRPDVELVDLERLYHGD